MSRQAYYINKVFARASTLALLLAALFASSPLSAQLAGHYSQSRPLVIVGDWELPPYAYNDPFGEPSGFCIDVLDAILDNLRIPHKFAMKGWPQAKEAFETRQADLIIDPTGSYQSAPYRMSHSILNYYKVKIASRTDMPPIQIGTQLNETKGVVFKSNDPISERIAKLLVPGSDIECHSTKNALVGLANGNFDYFVWGEQPLRWKIKEFNLEDKIVLNEIDLPVGEIRLASHNEELIIAIDDQYARLKQSGKLAIISDKWFHPERIHNDTSPLAVYITVAVVLLTIALFLLNRYILRKVRMASRTSSEMENMMRQALDMANYQVIFYDVHADLFTNRHGNMLPDGGLTLDQLIVRIHPDEQGDTRKEIKKLTDGEANTWVLNNRWNAGTEEAPVWYYIYGHAIAEHDDEGHTRFIMGTIKNVTHEYEQERKDKELASKYFKIFDSTLVAMSFYDKEGMLIDLNENMRKLCGFDQDGERFFRQTSLFDVPIFRDDLDRNDPREIHACQHMYYPENGIDKYIEFRIKPTYIGGELYYYIVTTRDVTHERSMYMELHKQDIQLHETSSMINKYERQLRYLLENSQMWVWRSSLKDKRITFSRTLSKEDFSETFQEHIENLYEEDQVKALKQYDNLRGADTNYNLTLHYRKTTQHDYPQWFAVSGIPLHDDAGHVTGHFGIVRDISSLMEAQEKLKQETLRAEDSGKLKSVFLANMTHEIRTPLNAIVGFSDLLQVIEEPTERREFIRIIRNNCDMLIRLIDDIIEASNMNQGPLAIEAEDVDFSTAFNDICQTLAQRVQEPGVEFIVDNPYTSFPTHLDKGRLQQVITNFTTNAVKYTQRGHIKVGYRYIDERELNIGTADQPTAPGRKGIYMYCEDTGSGIPKEKQASVFERFVKLNDFVQGTGLGLSICKNIAERCGGHIGVTSEGEGQGSTFWIWIPCETKQRPS